MIRLFIILASYSLATTAVLADELGGGPEPPPIECPTDFCQPGGNPIFLIPDSLEEYLDIEVIDDEFTLQDPDVDRLINLEDADLDG